VDQFDIVAASLPRQMAGSPDPIEMGPRGKRYYPTLVSHFRGGAADFLKNASILLTL
jgi:hypothetical protein